METALQHDLVTIRGYRPGDKAAFERISRQWIENLFEVEPYDLEVFEDPHAALIAPGGLLLCAEVGGEVAGVCGLMKRDGQYELCKLAVDEVFRGLQIGQKLVEGILLAACDKGIEHMYLYTNSRLTAAITIFEATGFQRVPISEADQQLCQRAEIRMEITL